MDATTHRRPATSRPPILEGDHRETEGVARDRKTGAGRQRGVMASQPQPSAYSRPRMTRMNTDKCRFTPPIASPCPHALRRSVILPAPHNQRYPERPSTPLLAIIPTVD